MQWRSWFGRGRQRRDDRDSDIEREIRAHLELEAEEQQDRGLPAEEARYAAQRTFGNQALVGEDLRALWGTPALDALIQDLRYAVRTIRRSPGFAAIAIGSSALGIGACSIVFAIVNAAVFKPLPVDDPGRLMSVSESDRRIGETGNELSYPDFEDLRHARSFEALAASDPLVPAAIGSGDDPQRHWGAIVTANYFNVVRPAFAAGRPFDDARDDKPGEPPVVVLSYQLWQRLFGGDPGVVGRPITLNKRPVTVIGVTAPAFRGSDVGIVPEFWIPFSMIDEIESRQGPVTRNRDRHWLRAVGRLRPNIDAAAARAELEVLARTLNASFGRGAERGFAVERAGQLDPRLRNGVLVLFSVALGITVLVLLTACVNVANLLLGRASVRRQEIATRMALGAGRARIVRQLVTESLLLAMGGGLAGWLLALYVCSFLGLVKTPLGWPLDLSVSVDYRVLLFSIGLAGLTAMAFGLVPALRATKLNLIADVKASGLGAGTRDRFGLRTGLVVTQVAICAVLLLGMGLFLRSLHATDTIDLGLRKDNLLLLAFDPSLDRRGDTQSRQLLKTVLDRAQAVGGVESATLTTAVPLTFIINNTDFVADEHANDARAPSIRTDIYHVGPRFFETMGIRFVAGDDFSPARSPRPDVAIVNEAFAHAAFGGRSPLGRHVLGNGRNLEIVGLVATAKSRTIGEEPRPAIYLPILQEYTAGQSARGVTLIAKTRACPGPECVAPAGSESDAGIASVAALREAIRSADRSLAIFDIRTMESHVRDALLVPRLARTLSAVAGGIGLVIATIGVYGVVSFAVARRRRELGVRLAIGARPQQVLAMILREGLTLVLIGSALGVLAAVGLAPLIASLLYGVAPIDPLTFVGVPLLLLAVATLACVVPARTAARVDPVDVLRTE